MRVFTLVLLISVLTACASAPGRPITEVPIAATYGHGDSASNAPRDTLAIDETSSQLADASLEVGGGENAWWAAFGDDRLNRLIEKVLAVNTDLVTAGLRLQQAHLATGLARDALMPHADAAISAGYSKALEGNTSGIRSSGASLSVGYEVDLWGKLRTQRDAARWEEHATAQDLLATHLLLVNEACNAYWTLAFLNQRIASAELSLDRLRRTQQLVQAQFDAGAVSRLEVREAEQNIETQLSTVSELTQQRVEARNALTVLLNGAPWPEVDERQDLQGLRSPEVVAGIPAELLARRPDLRATELRLRAALANARASAAGYYPTLSLTGTAGGSSAALGDLLANPVGTLGAGVALPFLRWKEMQLNVQRAGLDYQIAATEFRNALYRAFTEVDNALSARAELKRQLESSQKAFDAAVEVERLYEVRYRAGATPLRLWLDAQETRRSAELALAQAHLSQLQNDATLWKALGGGY
jgi:NodT family efflux transporter outer membrane factor (OMF) lipoprotein